MTSPKVIAEAAAKVVADKAMAEAIIYGNQNNNWIAQVILPEGENFIRIYSGAASRVDNITLYTNKSRKFVPYGGGALNGSYIPPAGQSAGCMAGRSGTSIDQLVFSSTGPR